ncbi:cupin domain-containing protein [Paraburkholderia sp. BCC1876]|uniref:cupin domain-containing protein n=1 Tax=Paraburkholderia sp. BCC1876 TaxID=2676303 RepID=UPI001590F71B|nr:cupin domain-containing protein [Paraburkholderia sp. BCC1876]
MFVQRKSESTAKYEYGCDLRRLFPWQGIVEPSWGAGIASVRPGESTTVDQHDEFETFLVLSGTGRMTIEDECCEMSEGDVVFIEKNRRHYFTNLSNAEPLVFITIYWDSPQARAWLQSIIEADRPDR